jgi:hypothetical protein
MVTVGNGMIIWERTRFETRVGRWVYWDEECQAERLILLGWQGMAMGNSPYSGAELGAAWGFFLSLAYQNIQFHFNTLTSIPMFESTLNQSGQRINANSQTVRF